MKSGSLCGFQFRDCFSLLFIDSRVIVGPLFLNSSILYRQKYMIVLSVFRNDSEKLGICQGKNLIKSAILDS
jgi:hypothetical protein